MWADTSLAAVVFVCVIVMKTESKSRKDKGEERRYQWVDFVIHSQQSDVCVCQNKYIPRVGVKG